eukprot:TRINITY_DN7481_c0_g1_i1.p4 TRINITY_DN7481_c0_g1~~TRINITY_DN7481_c0_g1_i1.p4  ORF type:complete len:130 (+),score=26.41 TRINITY_DN7481_c0_g1_i1:1959-2348(+)
MRFMSSALHRGCFGSSASRSATASKSKEHELLPEKVVKNAQMINKVRVFVAMTAGMVAGVLGLTGFIGFVAFFVMSLVTTIYMHFVIMNGNAMRYVTEDQPLYSFGALIGNMTTYIVVWTLVYDFIHVF